MEMEKILSDSLMSKKVVCTHPHAEVTEVARTMRDRNYSCLVVTEKKPANRRDYGTGYDTHSCGCPGNPTVEAAACVGIYVVTADCPQ